MTTRSARCLLQPAALMLTLILAACTAKTPGDAASAPHRGYLSPGAIPDSVALSPPPPAPGSVWARLDEAIAANALALQGSARFEQAYVDAEVAFPARAERFACALGVTVSEEQTPVLYRLLERTRYDASTTTRAAKQHYQRARPFMVNGQPICTPGHDEAIRSSGSYPSGHTAVGWAWGLILTEIAPERATEIIQRARSYGHSRLVCNVHWYSDVVQGQALAAATVASLHANAEFLADLATARDEYTRARAQARPLARDCAAEAEVLAVQVPGVR